MNQLAILQIVTLGAFIGMLTLIYFLVVLTQIQIGGFNYAPVDHFETYQHCKQEVSDV